MRALCTSVWLALSFSIPVGFSPTATAGAALDVDLELVLAVDVSDSMSADELRLQRDGYVSAFRDPGIAAAIGYGEIGRIAVLYLEWAGPDHLRVLRPWTVLSSLNDAAAFAHALAAEPLATGSPGSDRAMSFGTVLDPPPIATATATSISAALLVALGEFRDRGPQSVRRVIDVSGDGTNNAGPPLAPVRDLLVSEGIVINGLPLTWPIGDSAEAPFAKPFLERYYEACVIGGPGAFSIVANHISGFREAVRQKLLMEIVERESMFRLVRVRQGESALVDCGVERN